MHQNYTYEHQEALNAIREYSPYSFDWSQERTPAEWAEVAEGFRNYGTHSYGAKEESFANCDTDGFLSQWAHGVTARIAQSCASLADNHGWTTYRALFDINTGEMVPAFLVNFENRWGHGIVTKWSVRKSWDEVNEYGPLITFSCADSNRQQAKHYAKHGYTQGLVRARSRMTSDGHVMPLEKYDRTSYEVITTNSNATEDNTAHLDWHTKTHATVILSGDDVRMCHAVSIRQVEAHRAGQDPEAVSRDVWVSIRRDEDGWFAEIAEEGDDYGQVIDGTRTKSWKASLNAAIRYYSLNPVQFEIEHEHEYK